MSSLQQPWRPLHAGAVPPAPAEPQRRPWWLAKRVLAAAVGIVLIAGGATAAVALNEVGRLAEALSQNKPVRVSRAVLAPTSRGEAQTLLLVGNDERPPPKDNPGGAVLPHSNEMLLVRIDPAQPTIALLSIPRELKVPIHKPDGEVEENRINSAYTYGWENGGGTAGGVKLMLQTIKQVLGLSVNQVFITNFHKFAKAVNAMGCIYMTVDKRYFHVNEPGGEQYFEINLQPGYQRLCGKEALEFVANRHESTSVIRDARDQRFLLETKAEYGPSLLSQRERFEDIFGRYVESTLSGEGQILQLLYLLVESSGKPVRQIPFHVTFEPTFDSATPEQIHEAVSSFLGGTAAIAPHRIAASHARPSRRSEHSSRPAAAEPQLTPTSPEELALARSQAPNLPFALEYPRARDADGEASPDELRLYHIDDLHGRPHPIYAIVIDRGPLGQYYDVMGTDWSDPPVLRDPAQKVQLGSRTYELSYVGEKVKTIAWREGGAVYWIENTLTDDVSPYAMLAMAEQTQPVFSPRAGTGASTPIPTSVRLTPDANAASDGDAKIATGLGAVTLLVIAGLAGVLVTRRRELRRLHEQMLAAFELEERTRALLATHLPPPARAAVAPTSTPLPAPADGSHAAPSSASRPGADRVGALAAVVPPAPASPAEQGQIRVYRTRVAFPRAKLRR